jgi:hypothetical protein
VHRKAILLFYTYDFNAAHGCNDRTHSWTSHSRGQLLQIDPAKQRPMKNRNDNIFKSSLPSSLYSVILLRSSSSLFRKRGVVRHGLRPRAGQDEIGPGPVVALAAATGAAIPRQTPFTNQFCIPLSFQAGLYSPLRNVMSHDLL